MENDANATLTRRSKRERMAEKAELLRIEKGLLAALPTDLVQKFHLEEGSYLKVEPVSEAERKKEAWEKISEIIAKPKLIQGEEDMTDDEILEEMYSLRREQNAKSGV